MATVLVTGSNRGIGLELCKQFAARGDRVIAACRKTSDELERIGAEVHTDVDVTSGEALCRLAGKLSGVVVDILVCNAGVLQHDSLDHLDVGRVLAQFQTNAVGPLVTVQALLGCLRRGSKVGLITSRMGSMSDNTSGGYYGYRMSKAALNAAGVSLALDLKPKGVAVALLHPGFVRTEMTEMQGTIEPRASAAGLIARLDALSVSNTGAFLHMNGEALPF